MTLAVVLHAGDNARSFPRMPAWIGGHLLFRKSFDAATSVPFRTGLAGQA